MGVASEAARLAASMQMIKIDYTLPLLLTYWLLVSKWRCHVNSLSNSPFGDCAEKSRQCPPEMFTYDLRGRCERRDRRARRCHLESAQATCSRNSAA